MRVLILPARKWPRVKNHLDGRHCPVCGATIHGTPAQKKHQAEHAEMEALLDALCAAAGIDRSQFQAPEPPMLDDLDDD